MSVLSLRDQARCQTAPVGSSPAAGRFEAALCVRALDTGVRLHGLDQRGAVGVGRQAEMQANRGEFTLGLAVHALQHSTVFGGDVEEVAHAGRFDLDLEQETVRLDAMQQRRTDVAEDQQARSMTSAAPVRGRE